jgi:hypothetical protein
MVSKVDRNIEIARQYYDDDLSIAEIALHEGLSVERVRYIVERTLPDHPNDVVGRHYSRLIALLAEAGKEASTITRLRTALALAGHIKEAEQVDHALADAYTVQAMENARLRAALTSAGHADEAEEPAGISALLLLGHEIADAIAAH